MKLNTIVFGALIALSTSALQASEVKSNGDVKQPEILASVSTDKVVPLTAQEAKDSRGAYWVCRTLMGCSEYQFTQPDGYYKEVYLGTDPYSGIAHYYQHLYLRRAANGNYVSR